MLKATQNLIRTFQSESTISQSAGIANTARANLIAERGGSEDANALLALFMEDPTNQDRECLLEPIMHLGNHDTAQTLVAKCFEKGRLCEGVLPGVLRAIGFLGHAEARDLLWAYAQHEHWGVHSEAVLGLLNLPCAGLEPAIESAIRNCSGQSLFPEFLPALAHKTENPALLPWIYQLGRCSASTDCLGGIIYGIALFGEAGTQLFDALLVDPHWETWGTGTGNDWWAYHGFRHLGGRLSNFARTLRATYSTLEGFIWEQRVRIWMSLVEHHLARPLPYLRSMNHPHELTSDIHSAAFDWSSPKCDDSLSGLVWSDGLAHSNTLHDLSKRLADRISHEVAETEWGVM